MCGIAGIAYPTHANRRVRATDLLRMRDVMFHRGPDDGGLFIDGRIGLAHRRLSIVDVAQGSQPMKSVCGGRENVIVYNGEVYNHADQKADLEARGHVFQTRCDTETILHLYEEFGEDCVDYLRGMFAFAIWDAKLQQLLIARDRLGVKPIYYVHASDGSLYFASEIKALIEARAVRPAVNLNALPDQLANHGTSSEETLFEGVKRLQPGHTLIWKNGAVSIREYWNLDFRPKHDAPSERDLIDEWHEHFRASVRMRLMSDVPLGMFLSGGIDSSAIAAEMSRVSSEPIKTFSVAFNERNANELHYARLVARALDTDHHEVVVSPAEFFEALPKLVWHEDEPLGFLASVPLYFVSKLAAEHVKVVLTGEGADETLAGYGRYAKALKLLEMGGRYESVAPAFLRAAVREGVATLPAGLKLERTFLARDADIESLFFDNFSVFSRQMQTDLFTRRTRDSIADLNPYTTQNSLAANAPASDTLDRLLYADIKTYLHELLMKQDQMSMAASIESRVPFLDHRLVEFSVRLPRQAKLRSGTTKWILREAMKGILPDEILTRPKMGFPVPLGDWLRGPYKHVVNEYILGDRTMSRGIFSREFVERLVMRHNAGENHDERLWSLMNFEIWQRRFIDGEAQ